MPLPAIACCSSKRRLSITTTKPYTIMNGHKNRQYFHRCRQLPDYKKSSAASNGFDGLPDDLIISIFGFVSSTADSPADLMNTAFTCKRFQAIVFHSSVLAKASMAALNVKASSWCEGAHQFLKLCIDAGNIEACYILGMIYFYCLQHRSDGGTLMAKAALASHPSALYSLAIAMFNGSGGSREERNVRAGVSLCAMAAMSGNIDAVRELGHCVHDGYGVSQNMSEGKRLLVEANAREALQTIQAMVAKCELHHLSKLVFMACSHQQHSHILVHVGCCISETHIANQFLVGWFSLYPPPSPLQLCSYPNCVGRPETRNHEFRRCSACSLAVYCSRACQALDWKFWHKYECSSLIELEEQEDNYPPQHINS